MTTLNEANEAVLDRWVTLWGTTTSYVFDNERPQSVLSPPWVRVVIRGLENVQETLGEVGRRRFLRRSQVFIQVFTALNVGTKQADELVQQARAIYEGTRFSGVWFFHGNVIPIGPIQDGLYQVNLELPFNYEEVK